MRVVVATDPGVVELNYTWLPTWIGMNHAIKKQIEEQLSPLFVGRTLDDSTLDEMHQKVVAFLVEKHPSLVGLEGLLNALSEVKEVT